MVSKTFECPNCEASGKIVLKNNDMELSDISCCPVCGYNIQDDDDDDD